MRLLRGLTLSLIALLPGIIVGALAYLVIGGSTDTTEWESWMYLPCYGIPLFCMFAAFLFGMRSSKVEEQ